jgi:hypothetical protein
VENGKECTVSSTVLLTVSTVLTSTSKCALSRQVQLALSAQVRRHQVVQDKNLYFSHVRLVIRALKCDSSSAIEPR